MDGSAAAIVTTNFDDCIERALENVGANSYRLQGDPHIERAEIIGRLQDTAARLIVIVSGPEACRFAQTLLPQLGEKVAFLFKLHGSCYMPETCTDTRLQRQQGLPAYAVDILDHLLIRTVVFVACFGGGDMNDNTDYLRMVHNKKDARLVWLQYDTNKLEPGLEALTRTLQLDGDSSVGLCLLDGSFRGEQVKWDEEPSDFKDTVTEWCGELETPWCKLVVLDLVELCAGTLSQSHHLESLGFAGGKRQDYNRVVEEDLTQLQDQEQIPIAKQCHDTILRLELLLMSDLPSREDPSQAGSLDDDCKTIRPWHFSIADEVNSHQPHAQSWVVSALYGLILLCGKQDHAAAEALAFAQNTAYLVGDLQSHELIKKLVIDLELERRPGSAGRPHSIERQYSQSTASVTAFIPSLDNVLAKASLYGAPPALFLRALPHRAILFADRIAIPPNVLTNSSVFVNDVLFGGIDTANNFYLNYLYPIVFEDPNHDNIILSWYRKTNSREGYISEKLMESQMEELDEYFNSVRSEDRYIHIELAGVAQNFTS